MATLDARTWTNYSEALAFVGNSLLAPMNQTGSVGLEPAFWDSFPSFDDLGVAAALNALCSYAEEAQGIAADGGDAVQRASVEYTKLFVGPPRPAASPWETMHRGDGQDKVGFGQATFEMQELLRKAGLQVSNENNQYADHIGIELLLASALCARAAQAEPGSDDLASLEADLAGFVRDHPLGWIGRLQVAVGAAANGGYIARLLELAAALLRSLAGSL